MIYSNLADRMAMRLDGDDLPDGIIARKWSLFIDDVGIKETIVHKVFIEQHHRIKDRRGAVASVLDGEGLSSETITLRDAVHFCAGCEN